jgi:hypothetical protein
MIKEIRSYIYNCISEVNPDLKPHEEYFTDENIADSVIEDRFLMTFGTFNSQRLDSNYQGQFDVTVEIWKNGYRETIDNLDNAFCDAIEIMSKAQDQKRVSQDEYIKSVQGVSITPSGVDSNDNMGKFTIQFNIEVSYNI